MPSQVRARTRLVVGVTGVLTGALVVLAAGAVPQQGTPVKLTYVGSAACANCHPDAAAAHAKSPHASLAAPLPVSMRGCEGCHGPGSAHAAGDKKAIVNPGKMKAHEGDAVCMVCHSQSAGPSAPPSAPKLTSQTFMRGKHPRKEVGCVACHSEHKGVAHQLKQEPAKLCVECHADALPKAGEYLHAPIRADACLDCHDAHASGRPALVKGATDAKCVGCHKTTPASFVKAHSGMVSSTSRCVTCHSAHIKDKAKFGLPANQHKPYADRNCGQCHVSTPDKPAGLKAPVSELCVRCHASGKADAMSSTHPPMKQKLCTTCHSPHGSRQARPPLFKANPDFVCLSCHKAVDKARSQKYTHAPVEAGNCMTCHNGHKSNLEKLLTKSPMDLCQSCHPNQRKFTHPVGSKTVMSRAVTIIDPRNKKPLTCASCHDVHGGPHEYISQADFRRDLCIQCHKGGMSDQ